MLVYTKRWMETALPVPNVEDMSEGDRAAAQAATEDEQRRGIPRAPTAKRSFAVVARCTEPANRGLFV